MSDGIKVLDEGDAPLDTEADDVLGGLMDLSDEEIMNQDRGFAASGNEGQAAPEVQAEAASEEDEADAVEVATTGTAGSAAVADHTTPKQTEANQTNPAESATSESEGAKASGTEDKAPNAEEKLDYEALYNQVMAPFKANGKEFKPTSVEEVVRLAQMGANYTKKMQALKPNLKLMRMLENNGLLDETKLSFLIDIEKKDPKAIQKLLHDSKIDPLDLDTSAPPVYQPGNHSVSDQEMAFHDVLREVRDTPQGTGTILHINDQWDQVSKQAIYQEPALLGIINEHRANGIYDRISAEIERQQTLGQLSNIPFIQAYKLVGDQLHNAGKLAIQGGSQAQQPGMTAPVTAGRQVLETRPAAVKSAVSNGDKAKAASAGPKAAPKQSPKSFDPFAMTDEEIMAITSPRF